MSTAAQVNANRQNAQLSSGPKSDRGKANSALNNFRHGFTGAFCILDWEDKEEYDQLYGSLLNEHQPAEITEQVLVQTMAQSYWLRQRALNLQQMCFSAEIPMCEDNMQKQLALYLRYQTTHDRAFTKALDQLLKLRAAKTKQEIGFESQERKRSDQLLAAQRREAQEKRREAAERRAQELHQARLCLTKPHAQRQEPEIVIPEALKMTRTEQRLAA